MKPYFVTIACLAISFQVMSQQAVLVKDLETSTPALSLSRSLIEFDGLILLSYNDGIHGEELFYMDSPEDEPLLLKDIYPGGNSSSPSAFTIAEDKLFFIAQTTVISNALWVTDGTTEGTHTIMDGGGFSALTAFGKKLIFKFTYQDEERVYVTDGTSEGTKLLKTFREDGGTYPEGFPIVNGKVLLRGNDGSGYKYWTSDGTQAGTQELAGSATMPAIPYKYYSFNGYIYFSDGLSVWKSDGTPHGTTPFEPFFNHINTGTIFRGDFHFTTNGTRDFGFWKLNKAGVLQKLISGNNLKILAQSPDMLLLNVDDVLWKSNGTLAGTSSIAGISEGGKPFIPIFAEYINASNFLIVGRHLSVAGDKAWVTNGTAEGTQICEAFKDDSWFLGYQPVRAKNHCFLPSGGVKNSLFGFRGAPNEVFEVPQAPTTTDSYPSSFFRLNDEVLFTTSLSSTYGTRLWITGGGAENTRLLDLDQNYVSTNFKWPIKYNGQIFFDRSDDEHGTELWKTDGTAAGTGLLKDMIPGKPGSDAGKKFIFKDKIFFWNRTGVSYTLWSSDGTAEGTVSTATLRPPINNADVYVTEDAFYYVGEKPATGKPAIFSSDGTTEGSFVLHEFEQIDTYGSNIRQALIPMNGDLYFLANDGVSGLELWKMNLETKDFSIVKDIYPGATWSYKNVIRVIGNKLFFVATDPEHGNELWVSDGTEEGTRMVKDINEGTAGTSFYYDGEYDGKLYIHTWYNDEVQTWMTDGTEENTSVFNEDGCYDFFTSHGKLFFNTNGRLYQSLGTASSTTEIDLGNRLLIPYSSFSFFEFDDLLLFKGNSADAGLELWAIDLRDETESIDFEVSDKNYDDPDFELVATASSGLPVSFSSSDTKVLTIQDNVAHIESGGSVTIRASQGGTSTVGAAYKDVTIAIARTPQTLDFDELLPIRFEKNDTIHFKADASSTLPVKFESANSAVVKIRNNAGVMTGAGEVTITARQRGTKSIDEVSVSRTLTILKGVQYISFPPTRNVDFTGEPILIEASTSSGLELQFESSNVEIVEIDGNYMITKKPGAVTITATNAGDENYEAATDQQLLIVNKNSQEIIFDAPDTLDYSPDLLVELVATTSSGLQVEFVTSDSAILTIDGKVATIHKAGQVTITAIQKGNDIYAEATLEHNLFIRGTPQVISFDPIETIKFSSQKVGLKAVSSSGLQVFFESLSENIAIVNGDSLELKGIGTVKILARQPGNEAWLPAQTEQTVSIEKGTQSITFQTIPPQLLSSASLKLSASSTSGLPISYSTNSELIEINGDEVTFLAAGHVSIVATQAGNDNYYSANSEPNVFCINPDKPVISWSDDNTAILSSNEGTHEWYRDDKLISNTGSALTLTNSGIYTTITKAGKCKSEVSDFFTVIITNAEKNNIETFGLYPTVANKSIRVNWKAEAASKGILLIYNTAGQLMHYSKITGGYSEVSVENLPSGNYKGVLITDVGQQSKTFILEH
jgi:ELWxxDGT repeat protein